MLRRSRKLLLMHQAHPRTALSPINKWIMRWMYKSRLLLVWDGWRRIWFIVKKLASVLLLHSKRGTVQIRESLRGGECREHVDYIFQTGMCSDLMVAPS